MSKTTFVHLDNDKIVRHTIKEISVHSRKDVNHFLLIALCDTTRETNHFEVLPVGKADKDCEKCEMLYLQFLEVK